MTDGARHQLAAVAVIAVGGWLRFRGLAWMEFKADEQLALQLGTQLLHERHWASVSTWPTHGMPSSNNIGNAPLFTWLVAGVWAIASRPVAVCAAIAAANTACLYPLWRWLLRHLDRTRALLTLAIVAVSPFAVMNSRKIWTQSLLCIGVVLALWAIEWWRAAQPWRAVTLSLLAVLFLGQLHQSGPIALAVLPIALAVQRLIDARRGITASRWRAPNRVEAAVAAAALALVLVFWLPYLQYLWQLPWQAFAERPTLPAPSLDLVWRIVAPVRATDVFDLLPHDRDDFVADAVRRLALTACLWLGTPLAAFGVWRWWRAPQTLPVVGFWWIAIVAAFILARIPVHTFYVLVLMPLPAALASGAFDGSMRPRFARALTAWRAAYVLALFVLTFSMQNWLFERGGTIFGSRGGYGVAYAPRLMQAQAIAGGVGAGRGDGSSAATGDLPCHRLPGELVWLANWVDANAGARFPPADLELCDDFVGDEGSRLYRWQLRGARNR